MPCCDSSSSADPAKTFRVHEEYIISPGDKAIGKSSSSVFDSFV